MWGNLTIVGNSKNVIVLSKMHFKKDNGDENNINVAQRAKNPKKVQFRDATKAKINVFLNFFQ